MKALRRYGLSGGLVAAAAVTLLGTGALVEAFLWSSSTPTSPARPPSAAAAPSLSGRPDAVAQQQIGSAPTPPPSSGAPPRPAGSAESRTAAVPLTARFARGPDGLAGYPATVTVANQGAATVSGWTVTLTLPRPTLSITDVEGATVTRNGAVWTFTPTAATVNVGPAGSVTVSFRVSGAALLDAAPTACRIDANPCQGVG